MTNPDQTTFGKAATEAVAGIAALLDPHIEAGANPSLIAFGAMAFGANLLAQTTSPRDAAKTLKVVAQALDPKAATAADVAANGGAALEWMAGEFAAMAAECVAAIDSGRTTWARELLSDAARKLAPLDSSKTRRQ